MRYIGLVVQWIVPEFPKLLIQVRFLARPQKDFLG